MTEASYERAREAFVDHEAFAEREENEERAGGNEEGKEFLVRTTDFDATVQAEEIGDPEGSEDADDAPDGALRYRVHYGVPTLSAAVDGPVEAVVEEGWFDTFSLRLEDAAMAVPGTVDIEGPETSIEGESVHVEAAFETNSPDRATSVAKALVDYVEGTYVEGVIPGYEYRPPVSDLLANARQSGGDREGGESGTNADGPTAM
jgi:hypothetical protein